MDTPGAGDGNRTRDTLLGGQMLYRLSYTDVACPGRRYNIAPGLPVFPGRQKTEKGGHYARAQ